MSSKEPHICEPTDQSKGRPATFIFLHGYADDAEGLPLGFAQQFQFNHKLPYLRWLLPNAPIHPDARERAWYMPRALPNAAKLRVPGHEEEEESKSSDDDDEKGIMATVDKIDQLIESEISRGVDPSRIVVGGFSQGCAVSLVWSLVSSSRNKIAGVACLSGYFPLADQIERLRRETEGEGKLEWFYIHGGKDVLVPRRFFERGKEELKKHVKDETKIEDHLYEGMGHSTCNAELRDMLAWLGRVVPP